MSVWDSQESLLCLKLNYVFDFLLPGVILVALFLLVINFDTQALYKQYNLKWVSCGICSRVKCNSKDLDYTKVP